MIRTTTYPTGIIEVTEGTPAEFFQLDELRMAPIVIHAPDPEPEPDEAPKPVTRRLPRHAIYDAQTHGLPEGADIPHYRSNTTHNDEG